MRFLLTELGIGVKVPSLADHFLLIEHQNVGQKRNSVVANIDLKTSVVADFVKV